MENIGLLKELVYCTIGQANKDCKNFKTLKLENVAIVNHQNNDKNNHKI